MVEIMSVRFCLSSITIVLSLGLTYSVRAQVNETPNRFTAVLFEPCTSFDLPTVAGPLLLTARLENYVYREFPGAAATVDVFENQVSRAGVAQIHTHGGTGEL